MWKNNNRMGRLTLIVGSKIYTQSKLIHTRVTKTLKISLANIFFKFHVNLLLQLQNIFFSFKLKLFRRNNKFYGLFAECSCKSLQNEQFKYLQNQWVLARFMYASALNRNSWNMREPQSCCNKSVTFWQFFKLHNNNNNIWKLTCIVFYV